jgi:ribose transport system substrate-binding protein
MQRAIELTEDILRAHPNVRGFYSPNAGSNVAIPTVVRDAGRADDIIITGHDDLPEAIQFIIDGILDVTFVEHVQDMGYYSIMYLLELADGREVIPYHEVGVFMVTIDTVRQYYPELFN